MKTKGANLEIFDTVILAPHPDDAAFSLGGILLKGILSRVMVVNVFSDSRYTIHGEGRREVISRMRADEEERASVLFGYTSCQLGFPDASLRPQYISEADYLSRSFGLEKDPITEEVAARLDLIIPAHYGGLLLAPLSIGNHVDHRIIFEWCRVKMRKAPFIAFYEDVGYEATLRAEEIEDFVTTELKSSQVRPKTIPLSSSVLEQKIDFLMQYQSQVNQQVVTLIRKTATARQGERVWVPAPEHPIFNSVVLRA